ncbi:MAG: NADH-quinone oxidoreductase subunit E [Methanopyri archaeon]|nr:NADH-quinone oxidoreductase subunit E [Methanopyri archaeon]
MDPTVLFTAEIAVMGAASVVPLFLPWEARWPFTTIAAWTAFGLALPLAVMQPEAGLAHGVLCLDPLSDVMVGVTAALYAVSATASRYSLPMMKRFFLPDRLYWGLLSAFALTITLAATSVDVGYAWMWLEASTIVSAALILVEGEKACIEGAWRYLIVASTGLSIGLLSVVVAIKAAGTSDLLSLAFKDPTVASAVAGLALVGFGTKVGLFPMHAWLPDAHGTAPAPVSAMLSGALLPAALVVYVRVMSACVSSGAHSVVPVTVTVGALTTLVAALLMTVQRNIKRTFAYSSMDVMGVATAGFGASVYDPGLVGPLMALIAVHALGKAGLFYTAGVLHRYHGIKRLDDVRGLGRSAPGLALGAVLGALAVTGAPPFATFPAEVRTLTDLATHEPAQAVLLGVGMTVAFFALNFKVVRMVVGDGGPEAPRGAQALVGTVGSAALGLSLYLLTTWKPIP